MQLPTLAILAVSLFLALAGFGIVIPALPFYTARLQGEGPTVGLTVGLLMASYSLVQFACAPLWGHLSDRIGRRPVFLAGLAGFALSFVLMGTAQGLFWLFAARILGGVLSAALIPAALAMVADLTSETDRGKGMGIAGAAMGLGFVFGPAIGGMLARGDDFSLPFFVAAAVAAMTFLVAASSLRESRGLVASAAGQAALPLLERLGRHGAELWRWLALTFVQTAAFAAMEATLALYGRDVFGLRAVDVGWLMALIGLVSAAFSGGLAGRVIRRFGEVATLRAGFALFAVGFWGATAATSLPLFASAMTVVGVGMACMRPSLTSAVSKGAGDATGSAMGLMQSCDSLARVAGPALGGALYVLGHSLPYATASAVSAAAVAFTLLALPQPARPSLPDTSSGLPLAASTPEPAARG
ncbi:MAG: MFS transporter [Candidatus Sericytochromatia bacterium]|uniref:MFS transporter n=1 Tax=Candidatus Tanganyikabacteria bacterium TaxID=2961651 RepID=A0A937X518_9BACT|nr:MFS transporter [Candidatus Tanganyikabacteria bacterium]